MMRGQCRNWMIQLNREYIATNRTGHTAGSSVTKDPFMVVVGLSRIFEEKGVTKGIAYGGFHVWM